MLGNWFEFLEKVAKFISWDSTVVEKYPSDNEWINKKPGRILNLGGSSEIHSLNSSNFTKAFKEAQSILRLSPGLKPVFSNLICL